MRPLSRTRTLAVATVACAAIGLPVAALAASPGRAAHGPALVAPRCVNAHPALPGGGFVWSANPGDGFAGGAGFEIEITNTGHHACTLRGVPTVAAVRNNGHLVGSKLTGSAKGPLVMLKPGATAHVNLTIHTAGAICGSPVPANVVIYLPGQSTGQRASMTTLACPGKPGGGVLSPSAIAAGTGIPLYDI